ncbi:TPA: hypothetical protein HA361_06660 [Candidatus Woesearchaeota archaeon]|nr:hypothetical protein [Candidatus Woesearchaeota archaeon]HII68536.1 hypothetical protein [Candidatus Woesearchaeota archaeon]
MKVRNDRGSDGRGAHAFFSNELLGNARPHETATSPHGFFRRVKDYGKKEHFTIIKLPCLFVDLTGIIP